MTERELLELAAKAAGIEWFGYACDGSDGVAYFDIGPDEIVKWNPLTDDGDALRLLVKVRLPIIFDTFIVEAGGYDIGAYSALGNDPYAATRRAIVRAAADIGKVKP
jgi:hypothetical protein